MQRSAGAYSSMLHDSSDIGMRTSTRTGTGTGTDKGTRQIIERTSSRTRVGGQWGGHVAAEQGVPVPGGETNRNRLRTAEQTEPGKG